MRNSAGPDDAPDTAPNQHVRPRYVAPLRTANDRTARLGLERPPTTAEFHTGPLAQRDDALALRAGADERNFDAEGLLDERDIPACCLGQFVRQRLLPTRQRFVDRAAVMEVALMCRKLKRLGAVPKPVGNADRQLGEVREDVELRERERCDPDQPHGIAERDEVEP